MRHEPERLAAAYLAGELGRRQRERFEAHMLACEECWQEVGLGRRGRALAESIREVARRRTQPPGIAAAVASYRTGGPAWPAAAEPPPARRLGNLTWQASGRGQVDGLPVLAHSYQDAAGRRVVLLRAERVFPEAAGARLMPGGATWIAEVDGVVLFCADQPAPSLVMGQDRAEVLLAAQRLGLS